MRNLPTLVWPVFLLPFVSSISCQSQQVYVDLEGISHRPLVVGDGMATVLIFTMSDCPVANGYSPEINALVKEYPSERFQFYLVHVDPDITEEVAARHARDYGLTCPIIIDRSHRLVEYTGATITPEVAVITGGGEIRYRGRIDNLYADLGTKRQVVTRRDLRAVLSAIQAGKPVKVARTEAIGCYIPTLN